MDIPYLEYFGLKEKPFFLTPDPHFYFDSQTHREALEHLKFFLDQNEGFATIYGNVGMGKTVLSRIFLSTLDKNLYNTALILNPIMTEAEFLLEFLKELGVSPRKTATKKEMFDKLQTFLLEEYKKGKETVLVFDEAQLLSDEILEFIRVLSNYETEKEKILHVVFFGQEEFIDKLKQPRMRYLSQRITIRYLLKPLELNETSIYINHRLLKAGSTGFPQFNDDAIKLIYAVSNGCPRLINIICDRCLLALYAQSKNTVDVKMVNEVLEDPSIVTLTQIIAPQPKLGFRGFSIGVIAALIIIALLFILLVLYKFTGIFHRNTSETATTSTASALSGRFAASKTVPSSLVSAYSGEYIIVCEKETGTLHLYQYRDSAFTPVKSYAFAILSGKKDKQAQASLPEGIFFTVRTVSAQSSAGGNGSVSYILNSPNTFTKKEGLKTDGLFIQGHDKSGTDQTADKKDAKTCIGIDSASITELAALIKSSGTPVVIVNKIKAGSKEKQDSLSVEINNFLESWKRAWESMDINRYFSFYAPDFISSEGLNFNGFKKRKVKVARGKKFINVAIQDTTILTPQAYEGKIAVVRFNQKYKSDNFTENSLRILYLKKEGNQWQILAEDALPS